MKIIYSCYGGTHSSPVAAAIHLGRLPDDRIPSPEELMKTDYYDKVSADIKGELLHCGEDKWGNQVYILGRGSCDPVIIARVIRAGFALNGGRPEETLFIDTLPHVNWKMRLGGYLSRVAAWVGVGRPLVIRGTQQAYRNLMGLVKGVQEDLWMKVKEENNRRSRR